MCTPVYICTLLLTLLLWTETCLTIRVLMKEDNKRQRSRWYVQYFIDPSFFFFFRFLVFSFSCRAKKLTIARIRAKHFARGPPTSVTMVYVHNMYKIKSSATATALLSRWVRSYNAAVAVAGRVYSVWRGTQQQHSSILSYTTIILSLN